MNWIPFYFMKFFKGELSYSFQGVLNNLAKKNNGIINKRKGQFYNRFHSLGLTRRIVLCIYRQFKNTPIPSIWQQIWCLILFSLAWEQRMRMLLFTDTAEVYTSLELLGYSFTLFFRRESSFRSKTIYNGISQIHNHWKFG